MKFAALILLTQAFAVYAKYDLYCTDYGITLENGDFCPDERHSFCCSRNLLQAEGIYNTPRNCVELKNAQGSEITRYCGDKVVFCC
ncbi:hypothetical protein BUE80_DR009557 [Diplocarpon rosae]|nr:hypothetical protein BUE80_DR009557 [Diplocarpon rosae]